MLGRRTFTPGAALCIVTPRLAAAAQPAAKVRRIGVLSLTTFDNATLAAVMIGYLGRRGYVVGRQIEVEERIAEGRVDRLPQLAAELLALKVDLIVAGHTSAIRAAREATTTVPIVMAFSGDDPVRTGFVASLARPGGNVTGVTTVARDLVLKTIELLRDAVPGLSRAAVLANPSRPEHAEYVRIAQASRPPDLRLQLVAAGRPEQYAAAFEAAARQHAEGLIILGDVMFTRDAGRLAALALSNRLPTAYLYRQFVAAGGLMSYGPDLYRMLDLAADYVDRIIQGASPADLPVQQPTTFKLAINLATAKALGLEIPSSLRRRADPEDLIR